MGMHWVGFDVRKDSGGINMFAYLWDHLSIYLHMVIEQP